MPPSDQHTIRQTYDLTIKRQLYAKAGIPEYWVIDVPGRQLIVFKELQGTSYRTQTTVSSGTIYLAAFPEVAIAVPSLISIPT
ncbi:MAG: Uma2 family endonuclease [Elainellaceae cyanobacterium]